jgi:hypothetical protein
MQTVRAMTPHRKITVEEAESIALQAFSFIADDEERLSRFLQITGLRTETVRTAASSPGFYAAILDYVAADEPLLVAAAKALNSKPEHIMQARWTLSPSEFD